MLQQATRERFASLTNGSLSNSGAEVSSDLAAMQWLEAEILMASVPMLTRDDSAQRVPWAVQRLKLDVPALIQCIEDSSQFCYWSVWR